MDITLAVLFRLQVINDEILQSIGKSYTTHQPIVMNAEPLIESFRERIQLVNNQISPDLLQNCEYIPSSIKWLSLQNEASVVLTQLLVELNLSCLRLSAHPSLQSTGPSPITQCLQATEASVGAFLSTDPANYTSYTTINWSRLIYTIITAFTLLSSVKSYPNIPLQTTTDIMRFDRYLELLRLRMQEKSTTDLDDPSSVPDYFCLWSSILRIANDKYRELAAETQRAIDSKTEADVFQISASLCPILSGSLKQSEYWQAMSSSGASQWSNPPIENTAGIADMDLDAFLNGQDWNMGATGWDSFLDDGDWAQTSQSTSNHGFWSAVK
jgi:hypothetical protein